jgi:hypothetical protein
VILAGLGFDFIAWVLGQVKLGYSVSIRFIGIGHSGGLVQAIRALLVGPVLQHPRWGSIHLYPCRLVELVAWADVPSLTSFDLALVPSHKRSSGTSARTFPLIFYALGCYCCRAWMCRAPSRLWESCQLGSLTRIFS